MNPGDHYRALFKSLNVELPLVSDAKQPGGIRDTAGNAIAVTDPDRKLSDEQASELAKLIVQGVNWLAQAGSR
jgi:hypothetical protein